MNWIHEVSYIVSSKFPDFSGIFKGVFATFLWSLIFSNEVKTSSLTFHQRFRNFLIPGLIDERGVTITRRSYQGQYFRGSPRSILSHTSRTPHDHVPFALGIGVGRITSTLRPIRDRTYQFSARSRAYRFGYGCLENHDHVIAPSGTQHSWITTKPAPTPAPAR